MKKVIVKVEVRIPMEIPPDENVNKYINDKINNYIIDDYKIIGIIYNPLNFPKVNLKALEMLK